MAAMFVLDYAVLIRVDPSTLTAGAAGSAAPGQRGVTLAGHSTLGYAGGFIGPLVIGVMLDVFGALSQHLPSASHCFMCDHVWDMCLDATLE